MAGRLRIAVAAGAPARCPAGLPGRARRTVELARQVGAPVLPALDAAMAAVADDARAQRAVSVSTAQTRVVVGGLLAAPIVLVPTIGSLAGADVLGFYRSPRGMAVLALGGVLLAVGGLLVLGIVRRAVRTGEPTEQDLPIEEAAELVAVALTAGLSVPAALRAAGEHLPGAAVLRRLALGLELAVAAPPPAGLERLVPILAAASDLGGAAVPTLRHLATELRADALATRLAAAERLPALLTFPTALCLLPATVLLIGAPIVDIGLAGFDL